MAVSDEKLVQMCNLGDAAQARLAFDTLYRRHREFVVRVAWRFTRDHDLALDVLQETFTYLLSKFPPTGDGLTLTSALTTLLYPVAKNSAITLLRKAHRYAGDTNPDELAAPPQTQTDDVANLLESLTEERREVLLLRFVDDMPLQDIAAALDIPLGTVKSRLHLAIKTLREDPDIRNLHLP